MALRARPLLLRHQRPQPRRELIGSNPFNSGNEFRWTVLIRTCRVRRATLSLSFSLPLSFSLLLCLALPFSASRSLDPSDAKFLKLQRSRALRLRHRNIRTAFYIRRPLMTRRELEGHTKAEAGAPSVRYNLEDEVSPFGELRTRSRLGLTGIGWLFRRIEGKWIKVCASDKERSAGTVRTVASIRFLSTH